MKIDHSVLHKKFYDSEVFDFNNAQNTHVLSTTPSGSSSGSTILTAAKLAVMSPGTETDGSILCLSDSNSIVGIKPTLGLTS